MCIAYIKDISTVVSTKILYIEQCENGHGYNYLRERGNGLVVVVGNTFV